MQAPPEKPSDLRTDRRSGMPLIDVQAPYLAWQYEHADRGVDQAAYQILVATRPELLTPRNADVWNSGRVNSGESTNVAMGGTSLSGDQRYWWTVRVWALGSRVSPWSDPASFVTLVDDTTSVAEFVWDGTLNSNNVVYARREFDVPSDVVEVRAQFTAHDSFEVAVDGERVGRGPAPSDPHKGIQVQLFDLTDRLTAGQLHCLSVIGQYHGGGSGCGVKGVPALWMQLTFVHADGSVTREGTDTSWRLLGDTPYDESAPLRGPSFAVATGVEDFDARLEPIGWREVGFDDSAWGDLTLVDPDYELDAQRVPHDDLERVVRSQVIVQKAPGLHVVDFGENLTGWPILQFHNIAAGTEIMVHYSDVRDPVTGRIVRNRNDMQVYYDRYVTRGDATERFEPHFKYQSFRYLEIEGIPYVPSFADIELQVVHSKLEMVGRFESSSQELADIYEMCLRTQLNCTQGVLLDCPDREQSQYAADSAIEAHNLSAFARDGGFFRKVLLDLEHGQPYSGFMWEKAPSDEPHFIGEWALHYPILLWGEYMLHGSRDTLEAHVGTLEDLMATFELSIDPVTGLVSNLPGTSLSDHPLDPYDESGAAHLVANCMYVNGQRTLGKVQATLGDPAAGAQSSYKANAVKLAINQHLFDGVDSYVDTLGSTEFHGLSNAIALLYDIVPLTKRQAVIDALVASGFDAMTYGGAYLTEGLWQVGEIQHLIDLTLEPGERWLYMLDEGATTAWEGWLPLASLCHAFTAYPLRYLPEGLFGIEPVVPGFRTFTVAPTLVDQLDWALADVPTPFGLIHARWEKTGMGMLLALDVPGNSTCHLTLAKTGPGTELLEGGNLVWSASSSLPEPSWMRVHAEDADSVTLSIGSGSYAFELIDG